MTNSTARAIVAGHGEFAAGLVSAVQVITGRGDLFIPLAVPQLSAADIERLLRETIERTGVRVVFTDLNAGSCTMGARRILRDMRDVVIVCGVNLPALLDFAFADDVPPAEAARHAASRGCTALTFVEGGA
jgi:PTS system N-acetylgalactosamine-specific IIA component